MEQQQNKISVSAIIVVILCAILALNVFGNLFKISQFKNASFISSQVENLKEDIDSYKEAITEAEATIAKNEEKLPSLEKEKTAAKAEVTNAQNLLAPICPRNSYSAYYCETPEVCKEFHDNVATASSNFNKIQKNIKNCNDNISSANYTISSSNENIESAQTEIDELSSEKTKSIFSGIFSLIIKLARIAGYVFLIMYVLNTEEKKTGIIACYLMAGAAFLAMFLGLFLANLCNIILYGLFYMLIAEKTQNRVSARVFAIVIAVIIGLINFVSTPFLSVLHSVTMIMFALILVPAKFSDQEYRSIAKFIFLSLITLGIYYLIWIYKLTASLNKVENAEKRSPVSELLLCIFLPLYFIFWLYKTAEITELYGVENSKTFKIDVLCLVLGLVSPFISSIVIQNKINLIVGRPE